LANKEDLSMYLAVEWVLRPDLIPNEVGYAVSEPELPYVVGQPPLFLHVSEIMHTECDTLQCEVFTRDIEVHDFNRLEGVSSGDSGSDSSDSGADGVPGFSSAASSLQPWPQIYHFVGPADPSDEP
jgi:hypothetical protein